MWSVVTGTKCISDVGHQKHSRQTQQWNIPCTCWSHLGQRQEELSWAAATCEWDPLETVGHLTLGFVLHQSCSSKWRSADVVLSESPEQGMFCGRNREQLLIIRPSPSLQDGKSKIYPQHSLLRYKLTSQAQVEWPTQVSLGPGFAGPGLRLDFLSCWTWPTELAASYSPQSQWYPPLWACECLVLVLATWAFCSALGGAAAPH